MLDILDPGGYERYCHATYDSGWAGKVRSDGMPVCCPTGQLARSEAEGGGCYDPAEVLVPPPPTCPEGQQWVPSAGQCAVIVRSCLPPGPTCPEGEEPGCVDGLWICAPIVAPGQGDVGPVVGEHRAMDLTLAPLENGQWSATYRASWNEFDPATMLHPDDVARWQKKSGYTIRACSSFSSCISGGDTLHADKGEYPFHQWQSQVDGAQMGVFYNKETRTLRIDEWKAESFGAFILDKLEDIVDWTCGMLQSSTVQVGEQVAAAAGGGAAVAAIETAKSVCGWVSPALDALNPPPGAPPATPPPPVDPTPPPPPPADVQPYPPGTIHYYDAESGMYHIATPVAAAPPAAGLAGADLGGMFDNPVTHVESSVLNTDPTPRGSSQVDKRDFMKSVGAYKLYADWRFIVPVSVVAAAAVTGTVVAIRRHRKAKVAR
jgi:hypothetical protein